MLNIIDIVSTVYLLETRVNSVEANPIIRHFLNNYGYAGLISIKCIGMGLIIYIIYNKSYFYDKTDKTKYMIYPCVVILIAVLWNIRMII